MNIPRHLKNPIDTSVINWTKRKNLKFTRVVKPSDIRQIIINVTHHDPYNDSESRIKENVQARQLYIFFARRYTHRSFTSIAGSLGKNHSTASIAIGVVENHCKTEPGYKVIFNEIESQIINLYRIES